MKKLLGLILSFWVSGALAATTPNSFVTPQTPNRGIVQFLQGTDAPGANKTLYTAGANGSRCSAIWMTTSDPTTTHLVTVNIINASIRYGGVAVTTVLNAGYSNAVPPQNILSLWPGLPFDQYGNPYIQLISGDTIGAQYNTAITAASFINLVASCVDY